MNIAREVRLRLEFSHLYPDIHPGDWLDAETVAEQVASVAISRQGYSALAHRVLPETHFEFRGQPPAARVPKVQLRRLADRMH
jgi:hypothetical protein